jgi:pectin methylesterase-like acyl-CoA thioesterase
MASRVVTVAQDGSGDFTTVQEAVDAVPLCNTCRTVIRVPPGVYRQPVYVPKTKNLVTLAGLRPEDTILTWNNTSAKIDHHQVRLFSVISSLLIWVFDTCVWRFLMLGFWAAGFEGHWNWDVWVWDCDSGRRGFYC